MLGESYGEKGADIGESEWRFRRGGWRVSVAGDGGR
jgi:hypothetical protein